MMRLARATSLFARHSSVLARNGCPVHHVHQRIIGRVMLTGSSTSGHKPKAPGTADATEAVGAASAAGAAGAASAVSASGTRGPVTWQSATLAAVVGGLALGYYRYKKEEMESQVSGQVVTVGKPDLGGPFELVDSATGNIFKAPDDLRNDENKWHLLYFGFTACPEICPTEMVKMSKVVENVAAQGLEVVPVFISVDPHRDTVPRVKSFLKSKYTAQEVAEWAEKEQIGQPKFHPSFIGLTGSREQVEVATKAYRVYFSKAQDAEREAADEDDYLVDHSIICYFLDPDGEFQDFFTQSATVEEVSSRMLERARLLAAEKAEQAETEKMAAAASVPQNKQ